MEGGLFIFRVRKICKKKSNLRNDASKLIYIPTKFYLNLTIGMCPYTDDKVREEGSRIQGKRGRGWGIFREKNGSHK